MRSFLHPPNTSSHWLMLFTKTGNCAQCSDQQGWTSPRGPKEAQGCEQKCCFLCFRMRAGFTRQGREDRLRSEHACCPETAGLAWEDDPVPTQPPHPCLPGGIWGGPGDGMGMVGKLWLWDNRTRSESYTGTSLVVQWLRVCASSAGAPGSIPGQGTRSCICCN